jgi:hypothetical protein
MNRRTYLDVAAAIVLAYAFNFLLPVAWIGFLAALPLLDIKKKKYALLIGFLIGFLAPMSLYLLYPIGMIGKLSVVMGQIAGIPSVLAIVIFPLFYGIVIGLSALFWSGFAENPMISKEFRMQKKNRAKSTPASSNLRS